MTFSRFLSGLIVVASHLALTLGLIFTLFWVMEVWMFGLLFIYGVTVSVISSNPLNLFRWFAATSAPPNVDVVSLIAWGHAIAFCIGIPVIIIVNIKVWRMKN